MKSKEIKNNVFERILFRFLCYHYDWMKTPFNTKENTCATNGYSIVFIDKIEGYKDESKRLEPIIYNQENCSFEINAKDLLMALDKISMVSNSIECEDCEGDGKVVWSFYGSEKD
ncbi:MAG: hypothetical protein KDC72_09450, partial [Bacteroidetes bacterium]|nr:hypothetical protein [Bacteroidota bacterium]